MDLQKVRIKIRTIHLWWLVMAMAFIILALLFRYHNLQNNYDILLNQTAICRASWGYI